jgi:hypothetical protein
MDKKNIYSYDISLSNAERDYNIAKQKLICLMKDGTLSFHKKSDKKIFLSKTEIEEKLNFKQIRMKAFEIAEVDALMGKICSLLADFEEFQSLPEYKYNRFYTNLRKVIKIFFEDFLETINKEKMT